MPTQRIFVKIHARKWRDVPKDERKTNELSIPPILMSHWRILAPGKSAPDPWFERTTDRPKPHEKTPKTTFLPTATGETSPREQKRPQNTLNLNRNRMRRVSFHKAVWVEKSSRSRDFPPKPLFALVLKRSISTRRPHGHHAHWEEPH